MNLSTALPTLLGLAWLAPLAAFVFVLFFGKYLGKRAWMPSVAAIVGACILSLISLGGWLGEHPLVSAHHGASEHATEHGTEHGTEHDAKGDAKEHSSLNKS